MKITKKISLVFFGLLATLIILELSMRLAGFAIYGYQNYRNEKELKNKSQYKIMCLGESTTFGAYPRYLQKILNKKYPSKFSVIDSGVPGINLGNILLKLDMDIAEYKPNFAVCMMGVNNGFISLSDNNQNSVNKKYRYLKLYKLYHLLKMHISSILKTKEAYADNIKTLDMNYAYELYVQKKYSDAERVCKKIIEIKQDDYYSSAFLAMLCYYHLNKKDIAYGIASGLIETDKKVSDYWKQVMYEITIDYNIKNKNDAETKRHVDKLIRDNNVLLNGRLYWFVKDIITPDQKREFLNKMYNYKENIDQYYGIIAIDSMEKKDYKKAEEYFAKAEDIRLKYPNKETYQLYKLILNKLIENNIKVLCMQYPVRSIESLKNNLKDEQYYDKIEFISNEHVFKQMLKEKKYDEIFKDQFAGDFGHCTDLGNTMIAENLVKKLEKSIYQ